MVEQMTFRQAMARIGAAVNVITTDGQAGIYGITVSAVCSVSDTPPTLLVCINQASRANTILKANGVLCVNVLAGRHEVLSRRFAGQDATVEQRFADKELWTRLATGSPVLLDASVALDCRITQVSEVGTHSVFFCAVEDVLLGHDPEGLIYFNRGYHPLGERLSGETADTLP